MVEIENSDENDGMSGSESQLDSQDTQSLTVEISDCNSLPNVDYEVCDLCVRSVVTPILRNSGTDICSINVSFQSDIAGEPLISHTNPVIIDSASDDHVEISKKALEPHLLLSTAVEVTTER